MKRMLAIAALLLYGFASTGCARQMQAMDRYDAQITMSARADTPETEAPSEDMAVLEQNARADAANDTDCYSGNIYDTNGTLLSWTGFTEDGSAYRAYASDCEEMLSNTFDNATRGLHYLWRDTLKKQNPHPCDYSDDIGMSVQTYLDADLMQRIYNAMTALDAEGAATVMRVQDNAMLAMVSTNGYSPTALQLDPNYEMPAEARNRVMEALPPGSVMKMLSAPICARHGIGVGGNTVLDQNEWEGIHNADHWSGKVYSKEIDLYTATVLSRNVFFAKAADAIGMTQFAADLEELFSLTDEGIACDYGMLLPSGSLNLLEGSTDNLRRTAFGQGKVRLTLPYLSMVTAAVCTDGRLEVPLTRKAILDTNTGEVISMQTEAALLSVIPESCLTETKSAMYEVANHLQMKTFPKNWEIFAKTGTASYGGSEAHYICSFVRPHDGTDADGYVVCIRVDNSINNFANQDSYVYEAVLREVIPVD